MLARLAVLAPLLLAQQPALSANARQERIARQQQSLDQQHRRSVRHQAIALHLSHTQTSVARSPLRRLVRQRHARPLRAGEHLILHHVLQSLIIHRTGEDIRA